MTKIDCLWFVMCPLLAPGFQGFFFMQPLTVVIKQTRRAIKLSIYLDVYAYLSTNIALSAQPYSKQPWLHPLSLCLCGDITKLTL